MIHLQCFTCSKQFSRPKSQVRPGTKDAFCSTTCRARSVSRTCPICGAGFMRKPAELRDVNYCSVSCSAKANMTLKPAPKGARRAPSTEFRRGEKPHNVLPVGSERVRQRHNRTDAPRVWVKIAEPNVWRERARLVYGPAPRGHVIHHINGDSLDDRPENLQALTRAEHAAVHAGSPNMSN